MNLINCANKCVHQKDGYCVLQEADHLGPSPSADCMYFSNMEGTVTLPGTLTDDSPRLTNGTNPNKL